MNIAQNPMGRCVGTFDSSAEGRLRWLLLGRKGPQRWVATAKSILNTPDRFGTVNTSRRGRE